MCSKLLQALMNVQCPIDPMIVMYRIVSKPKILQIYLYDVLIFLETKFIRSRPLGIKEENTNNSEIHCGPEISIWQNAEKINQINVMHFGNSLGL